VDEATGTTFSLAVQISYPSVTVFPSLLAVDYGSTPQTLQGSVAPFSAIDNLRWDQSLDGGNTWNTLSSGSITYTPPTTTACYYRLGAHSQGAWYFSNPVQVVFNPLDPGVISLTQQPSYNQVPVIATTTGHGGTCLPADHSYVWEISVEGQPWVQIGSGANYPGNPITGKTSIRRKVICNGSTAVSNVLYVAPAYTSVDFENLNYIRTIDVHIQGINTWQQADQLSMDYKSQSTSYMDGSGRIIQKVAKGASQYNGAWTDLVKLIGYDAAGRSNKDYLPYPTTDNPGKYKSVNVISQQAAFVTSRFGEASGARTYSSVDYDESPVDRVINSYAPGGEWKDVKATANYDFNSLNDGVHIWSLDYASNAIPSSSPSAIYPAGSLYKVTGIDEKNRKTITFTDISGKVILTKLQLADPGNGLTDQHGGWVCTYNVYDDLDRLRFVISPKAVDYLDNHLWALTQQIVDDLCFVNGYDAKGRVFYKKQPGAGASVIVYDQQDRPVYSQDANGKNNNQWQTTTYDGLGRVTSTGITTLAIDQASLQNYIDGNTGNISTSRVTTVTGLAVRPVSGPQNGVLSYVASQRIEFTNFTSDAGGHFVAYIDPNIDNFIDEVVAVPDITSVSGANYAVLTQTYYDDYTHASKSYSTADNSLFDAATNQQALALPGQSSVQTRGLVTTTRVKVISNPSDLSQGTWLESDNYYDDRKKLVQTLSDNSLGGTDISTYRFDFGGRLWGSSVRHMANTSTQFTVVSKNNFDKQGHLLDISESFNNTTYKTLAAYTYDEYGKLINRRLAPNYTGSGKAEMESLTYDYNIRGWLTGINKTYALSTNSYDQWGQFFGLYLGYGNGDGQFSASQYDGRITGSIWKSQGDNSMRKYDYTYDNTGRLTSALFNQRKSPTDGWSNAAVDLSEYISYADGNGNIQSMKRMGVVPGINQGLAVDDLRYTYGSTDNPNTNRLTRVDESAGFTGNGQLNDFKDGTNTAGTNDYDYDNNGNLVKDLNKGISDGNGVQYNYLDKPIKITIAGKSIVQYTYDAVGTKLSKTVTDLTVTPNTSTTTTYAGRFIYQDNALLYVLHAEGRMKIISPFDSPQRHLGAGAFGAANVLSGKSGVFEYFIKDQLSNVRMVLTEEEQTEFYSATMETSSASDPNLGTDEEKLFGKVDPNTGNPTADNELHLTRTNAPGNWTGNTSLKVAALTSSDPTKKVGPNMVLKVSAGDMINAMAKYFYFTNDPSGSSNGVTDAIASLVGSMLSGNTSVVTKMNSSLISNNLGAANSDFSNFINGLPNQGNPNAPKAYLNVLFFDEQFNFVPGDQTTPGVGTQAARVSSPNDQNAKLLLQQKAPKNGWAYIYLTNESNEEVDFDDLSISQAHGRISEETHYYSFGQKIAGISTTAFNKLANKYHYQGDYSEEEEVTGWNEFDLRMYDPQLGRWTGVDPNDQFFSPYIGMGNDPVSNVDPTGGEAFGGTDPPPFNVRAAVRSLFYEGGPWAHLAVCYKCETKALEETMQAAYVIAKVSAKVAARATISSAIAFTKGALGTLIKTAFEMNRQMLVKSNPFSELLYRNPAEIWEEKKNEILNLPGRINHFVDNLGIIFDPTGKKQAKWLSDLYFDFKYAPPEGKGSMVMKGGITVALTVAGHPEAAEEVTLTTILEGEVAPTVVEGGEAATLSDGVEMSDLSDLNPTHYPTRSKAQMQNLIDDIRANGIKEPLQYVEKDGKKYIVGGNHRYFVAQKLNLTRLPIQRVELPFAGYKSTFDLMLEGRMPGYWPYLK